VKWSEKLQFKVRYQAIKTEIVSVKEMISKSQDEENPHNLELWNGKLNDLNQKLNDFDSFIEIFPELNGFYNGSVVNDNG